MTGTNPCLSIAHKYQPETESVGVKILSPLLQSSPAFRRRPYQRQGVQVHADCLARGRVESTPDGSPSSTSESLKPDV